MNIFLVHKPITPDITSNLRDAERRLSIFIKYRSLYKAKLGDIKYRSRLYKLHLKRFRYGAYLTTYSTNYLSSNTDAPETPHGFLK
jgi:hypothetical protein